MSASSEFAFSFIRKYLSFTCPVFVKYIFAEYWIQGRPVFSPHSTLNVLFHCVLLSLFVMKNQCYFASFCLHVMCHFSPGIFEIFLYLWSLIMLWLWLFKILLICLGFAGLPESAHLWLSASLAYFQSLFLQIPFLPHSLCVLLPGTQLQTNSCCSLRDTAAVLTFKISLLCVLGIHHLLSCLQVHRLCSPVCC